MTNAARNLPPTATHSLRLVTAIMTDESERRDTPTIDAPPPTLPPGEADAAATRAGTMIPPHRSIKLDPEGLVINPQEMPELLYNQLMRVHQQQLKRDEEMFEPEGRFAVLQREQHRLLVLGFKEATAEALEPKINELAQELRAFSERVKEKDQTQDGELVALRRELESHKIDMLNAVAEAVRKAVEPFAGKLEKLDRAVEKLEQNDAARAAQANPPAEPV